MTFDGSREAVNCFPSSFLIVIAVSDKVSLFAMTGVGATGVGSTGVGLTGVGFTGVGFTVAGF